MGAIPTADRFVAARCGPLCGPVRAAERVAKLLLGTAGVRELHDQLVTRDFEGALFGPVSQIDATFLQLGPDGDALRLGALPLGIRAARRRQGWRNESEVESERGGEPHACGPGCRECNGRSCHGGLEVEGRVCASTMAKRGQRSGNARILWLFTRSPMSGGEVGKKWAGDALFTPAV